MNTIEKNGIPNAYTKGEVGDIYIDTSTGFKYKCESVITIGESGTLRTIYNWYGVREDYKGEADKYKQKADTYESVLTGEVTEFVIPDGWTEIRRGAFMGCNKLVNIIFNNNITNIRDSAFSMCAALKKIVIPNSVTVLGYAVLAKCTVMTDLTIPNTIKSIGSRAFSDCTSLTNVTLGDGFNCNGLDLSASTRYSVDTLVAMLTALADRTGQTAYTLTLGAKNLAKLSDAQKAIATDKNWTLA